MMKLHLILVALVVLSYCSIECQTLNRKKREDEDIGKLWNELIQEAKKARVAFQKYHDNVQKRKTTEAPVRKTTEDDDYDDKPTRSTEPATTASPTAATNSSADSKPPPATNNPNDNTNTTPKKPEGET